MKRALVVNPFGIGDVVFSMTLVEALRRARPDLTIGFLCNERSQRIVRMNPSIDHTFVFNRDQFRRVWRKSPVLFFKKLKGFLAMIRLERFDTLIDLSLGREYGFYATLIGIPRRVGLDFKGRGVFLTDRIKIEGYSGVPVAKTQLKLLEKLGIEAKAAAIRLDVPDAARLAADDFLIKHRLFKGEEFLAIAPGGGRSWGANAVYKQWDAERFAEAARALYGSRRYKAILFGDKTERELLIKTAALIGPSCAVAVDMPFDEVGALLLKSKALLCNDGGLLHFANALGVRTVSIFGPVDEKVYGPHGNAVPHEVIVENVPCRPCYQRFRFPPCPHARRCLTGISVEKVVAAVEKIA